MKQLLDSIGPQYFNGFRVKSHILRLKNFEYHSITRSFRKMQMYTVVVMYAAACPLAPVIVLRKFVVGT